MKKILIDTTQLRIHFKVRSKVLDKALRIVSEYNNGLIRPRTLGCGLFKVLDVSHNERIVIKNNVLNFMTHEQYNKFVERR